MSEKTAPKKRGRKPKNLAKSKIANDKIFTEPVKNNTMIIKLNKNKDIKNKDNEILPGYIKEEICEINGLNIEKKCWNCSSTIINEKSMPLKYQNNIFYTYGSFCCEPCSLRFIIDTYENKDLWSYYELFNLYNYKIYGKYINVKIPPNKLTLNYFGGHLTIDEYRNCETYKEINNPIIIPVKNDNLNKTTNTIKNKGDLKLYRRPKKEMTILNSLNIK